MIGDHLKITRDPQEREPLPTSITERPWFEHDPCHLGFARWIALHAGDIEIRQPHCPLLDQHVVQSLPIKNAHVPTDSGDRPDAKGGREEQGSRGSGTRALPLPYRVGVKGLLLVRPLLRRASRLLQIRRRLADSVHAVPSEPVGFLVLVAPPSTPYLPECLKRPSHQPRPVLQADGGTEQRIDLRLYRDPQDLLAGRHSFTPFCWPRRGHVLGGDRTNLDVGVDLPNPPLGLKVQIGPSQFGGRTFPLPCSTTRGLRKDGRCHSQKENQR